MKKKAMHLRVCPFLMSGLWLYLTYFYLQFPHVSYCQCNQHTGKGLAFNWDETIPSKLQRWGRKTVFLLLLLKSKTIHTWNFQNIIELFFWQVNLRYQDVLVYVHV